MLQFCFCLLSHSVSSLLSVCLFYYVVVAVVECFIFFFASFSSCWHFSALTWLPFIYTMLFLVSAALPNNGILKYTSDSITHYVFIFHVNWRQCVCNHVWNSHLAWGVRARGIDQSERNGRVTQRAMEMRLKAAYWKWFAMTEVGRFQNAACDKSFCTDSALVIIRIFFQFMLSFIALICSTMVFCLCLVSRSLSRLRLRWNARHSFA